jgi:5-(carboxyamino)imidazole ribonucleotide synthase
MMFLSDIPSILPQTVANDTYLMPQTATLGVLGGGQLGRFFLMAAKDLGYRTVVWAPDFESPAFGLADEVIQAPFDNAKAFQRFTSLADGISYEFENLPVETLQAMEALGKVVSPSSKILKICQHRILERECLNGLNIPISPFKSIHTLAELTTGFQELGEEPCILKTARLGYDGKGQAKLTTLQDCTSVFAALGGEAHAPYLLERVVPFVREVSLIVGRCATGGMVTYPLIENRHHRHILDMSLCPAPHLQESTQQQAHQIAETLTNHLGLVGILCIECFELADGSLVVNELAPRPHNSGHLTIEGCVTSQYEQQVRALCGFALGSTALRVPSIGLQNLMGELWAANGDTPDWGRLLQHFPEVKLHLYGKEAAKPGRKMGHLVLTGNSMDKVEQTLKAAKNCIGLLKDFE